MIKEPTVLILGAGASIPYSFPSGADLKKMVIARLDYEQGANICNELEDLGHSRSEIMEFQNELYYSERNSVDEFLEHRTEFIPIGKLAMTLLLIPGENERNLFNKENSWYQYLFSKLNAPFDDFDKNELSILTFNYDRSLDFYLFRTLKSAYGKSDEECAKILEAIPIVHLHGKLGALPWEKGIKRPYVPEVARGNVRRISKEIIIVSEGVSKYDTFNTAHEILKKAERIYFLGFGYHNENLRRLNIIESGKYFKGTAIGLGSSERQYIEDRWKIGLFHHKILDFLKEEVPWTSILE